MKLEIINPIDYPDWDKLLLTNEHYSFFQTSYWAKVLHDAYGYKPLYFTAIDKGRLAVLVPIMEIKSFLTGKRGVSLPFTDFCEPMIPQGDGRGVWEALQQYGRKAGWKYLEIRGGDGLCQTSQPSSWYYEHVLDLSIGAEKVFSQFRDSHKRNIKKAKKAGVEVDISDTAEAMDEFYRLHCMTRKMHGLPPQPFSFFTNIYDHIISKGHGLFVTARYRGQACAASVYFHIGDKAIYKYGASDFTFQDLRPNNLVMWKALEWYCEKGFREFSFGRTDEGHDGLRQFKAGWGTAQRIIHYYRYDFHQNSFLCLPSGVEGWQAGIFRKTPIPFLKIIGSVLYRHMG